MGQPIRSREGRAQMTHCEHPGDGGLGEHLDEAWCEERHADADVHEERGEAPFDDASGAVVAGAHQSAHKLRRVRQ